MSLLDRIIEQRKSLLIDRVVFGDMLNVAGQAECIDIGNVEAYWSNRPKEVFRLGEFPFVAPPFPYLFFLVDTPNSVRPLEEQGMTKKQKEGFRVRRYGILMHTREILNATDKVTIGIMESMNTSRAELKYTHGIRWAVRCCVFEECWDGIWPIGGMEYYLRENGSFLDPVVALANPRIFEIFEESDAGEVLAEAVGTYMGPVWFALSLMHCRNVTVREPVLFRQQRRQAEREGGVRFKVLSIAPALNVLREEGQVETVGLKQALHICRGHFKDYTEKGLFGKNKGIFWWNHHSRGDMENGVILKDYTIAKTKIK
jgi:hypothetical protein